ncbi:TPA: Flp pilus assembly complex ATPase component TadA [Yersinia enterocolitica]|nr:Flp pilus assembly complex ATPase component TadA [Yersinia enterocolitica]
MDTFETAKQFVFLNKDKTELFVSSEHCGLSHVQSYIAYLLNNDFSIKVQKIKLDVLRKMQDGGGDFKEKQDTNLSEEQKTVIDLFKQAKEMGASDIHLLIGKDKLTYIEFRIYGDLVPIKTILYSEGMNLASTIIFSMCDASDVGFQPMRNQDARLDEQYLKKADLFGARYSHTPAEFGLYVVMRILDNDKGKTPTLEELGYLPEQIKLCRQMLMTPEGMIVISGPTGSGKSKTLRTFNKIYLDITNNKKRVITSEDPVEGWMDAVQRSIVADKSDPDSVSRAWVNSITSGLRLDPDAMVIGEMRDKDSAVAAIVAALTGHLVNSTTHTPDALRILDRLIETFGIHASLVADPQVLIGLISQRLVQRLCPHCKKTFQQIKEELTEEQIGLLEEFTDIDLVRFKNANGCEADGCYNGVVGRIAIAEVIRPDAMFMDMFLAKGKLKTRSYWVHKMGGITRRAHLQRYLNEGSVDPLDANLICPLDEDKRMLLPEELFNG